MSAYTENQRVEQPGKGLFAELGNVVGNLGVGFPQGALTGKFLTADYADYTE